MESGRIDRYAHIPLASAQAIAGFAIGIGDRQDDGLFGGHILKALTQPLGNLGCGNGPKRQGFTPCEGGLRIAKVQHTSGFRDGSRQDQRALVWGLGVANGQSAHEQPSGSRPLRQTPAPALTPCLLHW